MAKVILIIDIGLNSVRAGIFSARRMEPLFFFTHPLNNTGVTTDKKDCHRMLLSGDIKNALSSLLMTAREKGFREFQKVFVGIPAVEMSIRIVSIPFKDKGMLEDVLPFELDGILPCNAGDMVIGAVPLKNGNVISAAVEKERLRGYLEILNGLNLDPFWLGPTLFSLGNILNNPLPPFFKGDGRGTSAFINSESIAVAADGIPLFFKPIKEIDDVKTSLLYLKSEGIELDAFYYSGDISDEVKSLLHKETAPLTPIVSMPHEYRGDGAGVFALSLHVKKGLEVAMNFRKGELSYTKERAAMKRNLKVTAVLFFLILGFLMSDMYLRYTGFSRELKVLKGALKGEYLELFPGETRVMDELYQLEAKLKVLKEEIEIIGGGVSALEIMKVFSQAAGQNPGALSSKSLIGEKIKFYELHIGEGRVAARGEADSFEGANLLKESLIKDGSFKEVLLTDLKTKPGGGAGFSLSITLREREL
ncbi:MAG: hypothetical protein HY279_09670 [Nitrospinae bacterium]|nr:hypothetical protein [Nitrospinota bacterium]